MELQQCQHIKDEWTSHNEGGQFETEEAKEDDEGDFDDEDLDEEIDTKKPSN